MAFRMSDAPRIASEAWSTTSAAPPEHDLAVARCRARTWMTEAQRAELVVMIERWPGLPFQRVLRVEHTAEALEVVVERFIGLELRRVVDGMRRQGVLLPLECWLTLVAEWTQALEHLRPSDVLVPLELDAAGLSLHGVFVASPTALNAPITSRVAPPNLIVKTRLENPELLRKTPTSQRTLVYLVAANLLELLTTIGPFARATEGGTLAAMQRNEPAIGQHPELGRALEQVLTRAIRFDPEQRWASLAAFRQAVLEAAGLTPAPLKRVHAVVNAICAERVRELIKDLRRNAAFLPPAFTDPALRVLDDERLENEVLLETLPLRNAPVRLEPSGPKMNLAPPRGRRWWPFG